MIELINRHYEPSSKEISFDIYKDGVETAWIVVYDKGDELTVQDIFPSGDRDYNVLGVTGIRELLRKLKEEFPRATKLTKWRYGGAKYFEDEDSDGHYVEYKI